MVAWDDQGGHYVPRTSWDNYASVAVLDLPAERVEEAELRGGKSCT